MPHKDPEKRKAYQKEYRQRPEAKAREEAYYKEYDQRPEVIVRKKAYGQSLERKAKMHEYRQRTDVKAKKREYMREYDQRPEVKAKKHKYSQLPDIKAKTKEWNRWYRIEKKYGLTKDGFEWILLAQGGNCLVCGKELGDDIHVDHDHKTGKVRGLVHNKCNVVIGMAGDDPELLRKAAEYLGVQG